MSFLLSQRTEFLMISMAVKPMLSILKSLKTYALCLSLILTATTAVADKTVIYSVPNGGEKRIDFNVKVLNLALKYSEKAYTLQASSRMSIDQAEAETLVASGKLDLMWSASDSLRESRLRLVPIPFDYGLLGYRVLIIPTKDRRKYQSVQRLSDLKNYRPLQGVGWVDSYILRDAGFNVQLGEYSQLPDQLIQGQGDFIPRSIREVNDDYKHWSITADISIDQRIVLIYKQGDFFYVNPENSELYNDLLLGLTRIYDNGELIKLISDHFQERGINLEREIKNRVSFRLDNPYQSETVRSIDDRFFNIYF